MNSELSQEDRLHYLKSEWKIYHSAEKSANENRLAVEKEILGLLPLDAEGANRFDEMTIVTGFNRSWDHDHLVELRAQIVTEFFPFKLEFKEDRKASKIIEDRFPDLWEKIKPALTTKPKKPSFSFKE